MVSFRFIATLCKTRCEHITMADTVIYCLAQRVRSKLSQEASSNYQDLRRIVGHANMLDNLTAELINLGYEHNTNDVYFTEAVPVEKELATPLEDYYWTDQNAYVSNDDQDSQSSEDSEDSEDADSYEGYASDSAESDSAEGYEGEDNDNDADCDYGYPSQRIPAKHILTRLRYEYLFRRSTKSMKR
jgi:hypothetical protein